MKVVINDTNIIIDLIQLELLEEFSNLKFKLLTTDFVFEELNTEQQNILTPLIENNTIRLIKTESLDEYIAIYNLLHSTHGLSFEDCSIWYYCKKLNGTLLTGDAKLRKEVNKDGIEVRGIIYLFDEFLRQKLITYKLAIEKIVELKSINNRLPVNEIEKRVEAWRKKY